MGGSRHDNEIWLPISENRWIPGERAEIGEENCRESFVVEMLYRHREDKRSGDRLAESKINCSKNREIRD
jgi:hypothetical protein